MMDSSWLSWTSCPVREREDFPMTDVEDARILSGEPKSLTGNTRVKEPIDRDSAREAKSLGARD
jgi:hypothetical protein